MVGGRCTCSIEVLPSYLSRIEHSPARFRIDPHSGSQDNRARDGLWFRGETHCATQVATHRKADFDVFSARGGTIGISIESHNRRSDSASVGESLNHTKLNSPLSKPWLLYCHPTLPNYFAALFIAPCGGGTPFANAGNIIGDSRAGRCQSG